MKELTIYDLAETLWRVDTDPILLGVFDGYEIFNTQFHIEMKDINPNAVIACNIEEGWIDIEPIKNAQIPAQPFMTTQNSIANKLVQRPDLYDKVTKRRTLIGKVIIYDLEGLKPLVEFERTIKSPGFSIYEAG